jgi:CBS domain-containing protein
MMNTIGTVCQGQIVTIDEGSSAQEAAQLMRRHHVGALVVTAAEEGTSANSTRVSGVITDRDLTIEALARGLDAQTITVGALTTGKAVAINHQSSLSDAISLMRSEGVRRLLVTGSQRELMGLISMDDIVGALAEELNEVADSMRRGIARESLLRRPLGSSANDGMGGVQVPIESLAVPWKRNN